MKFFFFENLLVLSGFLYQKFAINFREVGQIVSESARISLCLQKTAESDVIWPYLANFFQDPANFWSKKADRISIFLPGSVWHNFVWQSRPWCSQGICRKLEGSFLQTSGPRNQLHRTSNFFVSHDFVSVWPLV